jgi:hypothetical protein
MPSALKAAYEAKSPPEIQGPAQAAALAPLSASSWVARRRRTGGGPDMLRRRSVQNVRRAST